MRNQAGTRGESRCAVDAGTPAAGSRRSTSRSARWPGRRTPRPASAAPTPRRRDSARRSKTLETVTVTAQKRTENMQKVPISMQAIGETAIKRQDIQDFNDYAKLMPSVSYGTVGGGVFSGPGFAQVYMRGVASGGDGNHSASQPSVGMYLDEQPITTIQGSLDIHIYDVARIEALAGPAGHAVRREFRSRHDPHHHQQARPDRIRRRLFGRRRARSTAAASATSSKASSTCRSRPRRRSAWSAGRSTMPATSTTRTARARFRPRA